MKTAKATTVTIKPGDTTSVVPEFGRCQDVQNIYGLRRGTLYNLRKHGWIKSVLLRVEGRKSGVRLWHLKSIRDFILSEMQKQTQ